MRQAGDSGRKDTDLGGRTAQLYRYFPKMCHPTCGLEINLKRLKGNRNVRVMTMTEVTAVTGSRGNYKVTLKVAPRYVNENCTACGECGEAVERRSAEPLELRPGQGQGGLSAARHGLSAALRHRSFHRRHARGRKGQGRLQVGAVDLDMQEETVS